MRNPMTVGLVVHTRIPRFVFVVIASMICAALAIPFQARAETPLAAFCANNAAELQRTSHEMGLDPAKWASDPRNLARFGFQGAGDIDTLYHMVIDKGAPYITSHYSNARPALSNGGARANDGNERSGVKPLSSSQGSAPSRRACNAGSCDPDVELCGNRWIQPG